MDADLGFLIATAFSLGVVHTLLGPDHYLPFVAMGKCNEWSLKRTFAITALCGVGHVAGSVMLGGVGILLGSALFRLEALEAFRGDAAAWMLIGFGLAYFTWGVARALRPSHEHAVADGKTAMLAPWALFLIFILGPCEVLIPLMMLPAAKANVGAMGLIIAVFGTATVGTMLLTVGALTVGLRRLPIRVPAVRRYGHAFAGFVVLTCGTLIKFGL